MKYAYTKKHEIEVLKYMLGTNETWAKNALMRIYNAQTADEKASGETYHENGIGFNGTDANILTRISKWYQEKKFIGNGYMNLVFKKMPKYAEQLFSMIDFDHEKFDRQIAVIDSMMKK